MNAIIETLFFIFMLFLAIVSILVIAELISAPRKKSSSNSGGAYPIIPGEPSSSCNDNRYSGAESHSSDIGSAGSSDGGGGGGGGDGGI